MAKFSAFGTLLKRGDGGGPEVFATIANVRSIGGPSLAADTIDVTSHDSAGGWREFVSGLVAAGEISMDLVFDPDHATHVGLRTDFTSKLLRNFELVFPDATSTTWAFSAFVTAYSPNAPHDAELSASVSLQITGAPTLA